MKAYFDYWLGKANWRYFALHFAALFAFSWWAFYTSSPWTRALAAGGGKLPEAQPGFHANEPHRSLDALGADTNDYLAWQFFDCFYAYLNLVVLTAAIALALKATKTERSLFRALLLLPGVYFACELIENPLVAGFAAKLIPTAPPIVFVQQAATSVKMLSGFGSMFLGLAAVNIAALATIIRIARRRA